jgi:choline dehydrogenase-like flavoprotein
LWNEVVSNGALTGGSKNLGHYWMEHPHFRLGDVLVTREFPISFRKRVVLAPSPEFREEKGILNCGLRVEKTGPKRTRKLIADISRVTPEVGAWATELLDDDQIYGAKLRAAWEQEPRQENRIALGPDKDRFGIPRTRLYWAKSRLALRTPRETALEFGRYLADRNFGRVRLRSWLLEEGEFPSKGELGGRHHMGGTRMGAGPADAVVDPNCKLFGQANLYLAGSSVFPRCGHANPTLTIVQLALRLADHLHETA